MPAKFNNYKGGNKRGREEDGGADMPPAWEVANVAVRRLPKNCRGLVHIAIVVGYTGTAFRGLQIQTHEHISHTIEGTLLCALFDAGYLLPTDFEGGLGPHKGGTKLDSSSGISVEVRRTVTTAATATTDAAEGEGEFNLPANNGGGAENPTATPTTTTTTITETQLNTAANFRFARSCRTDKGVHAVRNVVSMFLRDSDWRRDGNDGMRTKINSMIPPTTAVLPSSSSSTSGRGSIGGKVMEVLSIAPVLPAFNPRDACSGRVYRYLLPLYAVGLSGANVNTTTSPEQQQGGLQTTIQQHIQDAMGKCSSIHGGTDVEGASSSSECTRCAGLYKLAHLCKGAAIDSWDTLYKCPAYASDPLLQGMMNNTSTSSQPSSPTTPSSGGSVLQPLPLSPSMCVGVASDIAGAISSSSVPSSHVGSPPISTPLTEELSLIISYANTYLYDQYCSSEGRAAKRFQNFSLNRLDGGGGGGGGEGGGGGSKQLTGSDNEAPRSLSRCELAPYVAWIPNPRFNNSSSSSSSTDTPPTTTSAFEWLNTLGGGTVIPTSESDEHTTPYNVDGDGSESFFMNMKDAVSLSTTSTKKEQPRMLPFLVFQVEGRSFLLHMIRKMVGTLLAVLRQGKSWWLPRQVSNNNCITSTVCSAVSKADVARVSELIEVIIKGGATTSKASPDDDSASTTSTVAGIVSLCSTPAANISITKESLQAITAGERVIRESLLVALMDASTLASVPMAPGPYLTQMFASYHNYDCMMRTVIGGHKKKMEKLRRFNEYKASQKEKQLAEGAASGVVEVVINTTAETALSTGSSKGGKKGNNNKAEEDDDEEGDDDLVPPYYLAYSHMLQDVFTKPSSVLDNATAERLSWTANLKVPTTRDAGGISANNNNATPATPITVSNIASLTTALEADEPISSNFYWRVVASEIALVDSGVYLSNDTDALLMLRDVCSVLLRKGRRNEDDGVGPATNSGSLVSAVKSILRAAIRRSISSRPDVSTSTVTDDTNDTCAPSSSSEVEDALVLDAAIAVAPTVFMPTPTLLTSDSATSSDVNAARRLLAFINRSALEKDTHTSHMTQFLRGLRVHDWRTTPPPPPSVPSSTSVIPPTTASAELNTSDTTTATADGTPMVDEVVKLTKGQRKEQWRIREYEEHRASIKDSYLMPLSAADKSLEATQSVLDRIFDQEVTKLSSSSNNNNIVVDSGGAEEDIHEGKQQLSVESVVTCSGADGWLYWGMNPHQQAAHRVLTQRTMNKISDCFLKSAAQSRDNYHTTTSTGATVASTPQQ